MRSQAAIFTLCLIATSCSDDPARSVKIVKRPALPAAAPTAPTSVTFTPAGAAGPADQLGFCPPLPEESSGSSTFTARGPCEFQHHGVASCESMRDDFIAVLTRKAQRGGTLVVYLNVEQYHGPGSYKGAQLFVAAQGGNSIFRWSSDQARATVGPDEAFVDLPSTHLEVEPMLTGCTVLVGPSTNYQYQCGGSREARMAIDSTEIVSGKLLCGNVRRTNE